MSSAIRAALIVVFIALQSSTALLQSNLDPTLVDAGPYGLVRVRSLSGQTAQLMDCVRSDGNAGMRVDKTFTVDPTNALHLYVAVEQIGFFVSMDGGTTWT